ncbi:hypothetical protein [Rhodanobacter sp. FW106-PBR-R2A-1-13]|uniref:hypothetical protein n=1 Tax=Rhodanobacter sp. FW106-PBR-R2A-1-13 TaxID=3454845 RepID=UPI0034E46F54
MTSQATQWVCDPAAMSGLDALAEAVGMRVVEVAHQGWPLGLLMDSRNRAWRVGALTSAGIPVVLTDLQDVLAEARRVLGPWVHQVGEDEGLLEGLDIDRVASLGLTAAGLRIEVDQAKAVAILAGIPCGEFLHADVGHVLRCLERGGALLQSQPNAATTR